MKKRVRLDHYSQNDRNNEAIGGMCIAGVFGIIGGVMGLATFGLAGGLIGFFLGCGVASKFSE